MSRWRSVRRFPWSDDASVYAAAVWAVLAAIELALFLSLDATSWHEPLLPRSGRLAFFAFEAAALAPLAFLAGWSLRLERRTPPARPGLIAAVRTVLLTVLLFFILASWALFHGTGQFLDVGALRFMAADALQIFQHVRDMSPAAALGPPLGAITLGLLLGLALPAVIRSPRRGGAILVVWAVVVTALTGSAFAVDRGLEGSEASVPDFAVGGVYTFDDLYEVARADRSGPLLHFVSYLAADPAAEPHFADSSMPRELRPQLALADYVAAVDRDSMRPLNVLLILVESLRWDQLVASGGSRVVMPAVEALAAGGVTYPHTYAQASHSNYSDMVPLSSQYPLRSAHYHVYPEHPTYPRVLVYDVLDALGYRTAIFSSQNENWGGMINYLRTGHLDHVLHAESYDGPTYVPRGDVGFAAFIKGSMRAGKIDDRFTVARAISWIGAGEDEPPFFIYMNLQNSHIPYEVPTDFHAPFGPNRVSFPIVFGAFPRDSVVQVMNQYANSLAYVDAQIAKVIDHLRATGQLERTIVIVTGDTGQAFFEHGFAAHANRVYEELVRVPLVIAAPAIEAGRDARVTEHLDVAPTILALLGLDPHPGFQGRSLLDPPPPAPTAFVMVQTPLAHQYAIVRDGYKLIYDLGEDRYRLFDLTTDPAETEDIATREEGVARALARYLDTWRQAQLEYYQTESLHRSVYQPDLSASIELAPPLREMSPAEPMR